MKYDSDEYRTFREAMREAGKLTDPKTVEIYYWHCELDDPYNVLEDVRPEASCIGRTFFLKTPDSDIMIFADDLPEETWAEVERLLEAGYYKARR